MSTDEALIVAEKQTTEIEERIRPQVSEVVATANKLVAALQELQTPEARLAVEVHAQDALRREKAIKAEFEPGVKAAKDLYDFWKSKLDLALAPLVAAKRIDTTGLSVFDEEQKRKRKFAEEARLAEVRKQQEQYAVDLKAAQDLRIKQEQEARLAHAAEAERLGNGAADLILETVTSSVPFVPPPPPMAFVPEPEPEKTGGSIGRDLWKYRIADLRLFVKTVADRGDLRLLMTEKEMSDFRSGELKELVEKTKSETPYPGVEAWSERSTAVRLK